MTSTQTQILEISDFRFDAGVSMPSVQLAYECYGTLAEDKGNVILLNHALTGSHHAHGWCDQLDEAGDFWQPENFEGWWNLMIGSGKPLDTDRYFIICANYLGSCYGSTGPASLAPDGTPWGARFPLVTAADQVRAQIALLDHLGIQRFHLVAASVGGLIGMTCSCLYPERVKGLMLIGVTHEPTIEHKLSVFEQILAIELDAQFCAGNYKLSDPPRRGLALARIICHKLFVDQSTLALRARSGTIGEQDMLQSYPVRHNTESYMLHQGMKFARRFDANAYIRIVDMWAQHDLATLIGLDSPTDCWARLAQHHVPVRSFGISTDACFLPEDIEKLHEQLLAAGVDSRYHFIQSEKGHDSFLLEPELYAQAIGDFLQS